MSLPADAEMVAIAPTSFDAADFVSRGIRVTVSVSEFRIGRTPVTQAQYRRIVGANPSRYPGEDRPVENVSWWDAIRYCNARSEREGLEPCYDLSTGDCDFGKGGYRLPTSTEWTVACAGADRDPDPARAHIASVPTTDGEALLDLVRRTGTAAVARFPPNPHGLHDMLGNVWEWCYDYYYDNQEPGVRAADRRQIVMPSAVDPTGPAWGVARVIRGGSFVSTAYTYGENMGYRCLGPDRKSGFTGFRVARSSGTRAFRRRAPNPQWLRAFSVTPPEKGGRGALPSLLEDERGARITTVDGWNQKRRALRHTWLERLGVPPAPDRPPEVREIRTFAEHVYTGTLLTLHWDDDLWLKVFLMVPLKPRCQPTPAVIVHWYDVDAPAGRNLGGYLVHEDAKLKSFGYLLAQQGLIAASLQWWDLTEESYEESMARLKVRFPHTLGLGRTVWDTARLVDYLSTLPHVDASRIGVMGHCLGGIQTIYAAALEERIAAAVACGSNCSVSNRDSNYEDYWYLGEKAAKSIDAAHDQQELLALVAPRPFLMALGKGNTIDSCYPFIAAAREVYQLHGRPELLGYLCDTEERPPSSRNVPLMRDWLVSFLCEQ